MNWEVVSECCSWFFCAEVLWCVFFVWLIFANLYKTKIAKMFRGILVSTKFPCKHAFFEAMYESRTQLWTKLLNHQLFKLVVSTYLKNISQNRGEHEIKLKPPPSIVQILPLWLPAVHCHEPSSPVVFVPGAPTTWGCLGMEISVSVQHLSSISWQIWVFPKAAAKGSFKKSVAIKDCH